MKIKSVDNKLVFGVFAVIVLLITALNIYMNYRMDSGGNIKRLHDENVVLANENLELKEKLSSAAPSNQESDRQSYLNVVEKFIDVTMNMEKEKFEERKSLAEKIMTPELYPIFYPTETFPYNDDYFSRATDINYYLQSYDLLTNEVSVISEFFIELKYNGKSEPERTRNVVKLKLIKDNTGQWIVSEIDELLIAVVKGEE